MHASMHIAGRVVRSLVNRWVVTVLDGRLNVRTDLYIESRQKAPRDAPRDER
jgi:hypothetical protein